jgi:hypothetical protein
MSAVSIELSSSTGTVLIRFARNEEAQVLWRATAMREMYEGRYRVCILAAEADGTAKEETERE